MARQKNWNWNLVNPGVHEVKLRSWKEFANFVYDEMLNYEDYVWRGQRLAGWPLEPTLARVIREAKISKTKQYNFTKIHLEKFKFAVRGRRGENPARLETDDDWWALGQHHGLATPLLDWTTSPFVAAFFAFSENAGAKNTMRAIYALHRPSVQQWATKKAKEEEEKRRDRLHRHQLGEIKLGLLEYAMIQSPVMEEVKFISPLSDENQRLVSQGGLFTSSPTSLSLEDWVSKNAPSDYEGGALLKIFIPNRDRETCLRMLNRMNINYLSLFPDLYGASRFCNLFSEIEYY